MAKLFGTDGVRGVAGEWPMVPEFALKLGKAIGVLLAQDKQKVAICRDTRISGQMLESALVAGLNSQGVDVLSLGVLPTPAMTNLVADFDVDMAIIITASHNPYKDNGIKLVDKDGSRFSRETLAQLEDMVVGAEIPNNLEKMGRLFSDDSALKKYIERIMPILPGYEALKGLRVVLDCANGAMSEIMPMVFKNLGAAVITLGNMPNGYNINKDSGSQHPEHMCETVVGAKAHIGIAVDGDGDRIIICDETGKVLDGDQIIAYLGKIFKENNKLGGNAVVTTIVSNLAIEKYLNSIGVDYYQAGVGEPNVIAKMKEVGSNVGGEESGHMILTEYGRSGDALAVALVVAYNVLQSGKKCSEIFPLFQFVPKKRVDTVFAQKDNMQLAINDAKVLQTIEDCRAKMGNRGKILVRPSGTEPKVQVWVWGEDEAEVAEVNAIITEAIAPFAR